MPQTHTTPIILSGWLYKMKRKSNVFGKWGKRWIVIQNESISWRHSKNSEVAGSIDIEHISSVYKVKDLREKRENKNNGGPLDSIRGPGQERMFVVKSRKRVLCLMAQTSQDCDRFVRGIQLQLDLKGWEDKLCQKSSRTDKYDNMLKILDRRLSALPEIEVGPGIDGTDSDASWTNTQLKMLDDFLQGPVPDTDAMQLQQFGGAGHQDIESNISDGDSKIETTLIT